MDGLEFFCVFVWFGLRFFVCVPTGNPKHLVPSFYRFWVSFMNVKRQIAINYFTMFLICLDHYSAAYDCSMAKKRRAEEQALGVPVNKRKSLLMKPRHYSPNMNGKEERHSRTEAEEDDGLLEADAHPSTGSKEQPKLMWNTQLVCYNLGTKLNIHFTHNPFFEGSSL